MFTGIVREVGTLAAVTGGDEGIQLEIDAPLTAPLVEVGGSVAINGVCLTAESVEPPRLTFHAVPETLSRSTLGELRRGAAVNLEPALRAGDPIEFEGEGLRVIIEASADTLRYCVEKGSITMEGVSLTVAEVYVDSFGLALIPHTIAMTTLARLVPGQKVNLEVDVLAKYVERLLSHRA